MNVQKVIQMDESLEKAHALLRSHLKVLLLHLAAKSENPGYDLQVMLREVLDELHLEVKEALTKKPQHLRLMPMSNS
jgi:hypothetical protein